MPNIEFTVDEESQTRLALADRADMWLKIGMVEKAREAYSAYLKVGGYWTWEQIEGWATNAKVDAEARRQGS